MSASTNEKIMNAAVELFAAHGYSAVSTKDIAKKAGVNESTLFRQYGDKRKLMQAAIEHEAISSVPLPRVKAALAIRDFEDAMRTFASCLMERFSVRYMRLSNAYGLEMKKSDLDAYVAANIKPVHDALAARIKTEQRAKRIHSTVHAYAIARALICVLYGHAASVAFWGDKWKESTNVKPQHVENYVTVWLRGIIVDSNHLPPCK